MERRVYRPLNCCSLLAIGLFTLIASGCSSLPLQSQRLDDIEAAQHATELESVPFFPQEKYQCGPAALATVLTHSGISVTPEELRDQVYIPEREGSLQVEILSTIRRHGRVPYLLTPRIDALLKELRAEHPVLVLQNLALDWYPRWHYAVVVGYEPHDRNVVLRSGTRKRHVIPIELFERTWRRGEYWAVLALDPGELPATAEEQRYLEAVVPLERSKRWEAARPSHEAALALWPDNLVALMGVGNSRYALGDAAGSLAAFRHTILKHHRAAAAHNNLAYLLLEQGKLEEALRHAQRAVDLAGSENPEYAKTLAEIEARW